MTVDLTGLFGEESVTSTPVDNTPPASDSSEHPVSNSEVKSDTSVTTPAEEPKPILSDLEYSSKIAHLAKQEKALVARKQELSAMQEQFKSYQGLMELAKQNPMAILDHFGLDYNSLTDAILSQQDPETKRFSELQSQIEALRQEKVEEAKKAEEQKVTEAENAYKWGIQKIAEDNADEFELVKHYGAYDTVYEVCKQYYEQTSQMLDLKEALQLVEQDLEEQLNQVTTLKKVQKKFQSPAQSKPGEVPPQKADTPRHEEIFSKSSLPSSGTSSAPKNQALSDKERRERALAWL